MIAAAIGLGALLLGVASLNGARWRHALAFCGSIALVAVAVAAAMGQPRPAWLGHKTGIALLGMTFDEGRAIYIWTRDGDAAPVAYELPWDEQTAVDVQNAMRQAQSQHSEAHWGSAPARGEVAGDPTAGHGQGTAGGPSVPGNAYHAAAGFYAQPQPPLPLKTKP